MSRRGSRGDDPGQLLINWTGSKRASDRAPSSLPASHPPPMVQRLKWDFRQTFPQPLQEAIDAGRISDEDAAPEAIRSIHDEHAREALATLSDLDAVLDARRRGVDPATGQTPRTAASRERLAERLQTEPERLEHAFTVLMDVYEEAFGSEARDAFAKAIRARHAGIDVVADEPHATKPSPLFEPSALPPRGRSQRIPARLPVPKPLPDAIAAGRFGREEDGKSVRPGTHEVRAITEQHAGKLIELLDGAAAARGAEQIAILESFHSGIAAYSEDFGPRAAAQLEAYVRRQAGLDAGDRHQR